MHIIGDIYFESAYQFICFYFFLWFGFGIILFLYFVVIAYIFVMQTKLRIHERNEKKKNQNSSIILEIFFYFKQAIKLFVLDCRYFWCGAKDNKSFSTQLAKSEMKAYRKLSSFPIVYILVWTFPSINRGFSFITGKKSFLIFMCHVFIIFFKLFNSFLFVYQKK